MKRAAWLTDLHLNFLPPQDIQVFLRQAAAAQPDCVLIGGDTGDAPNLLATLDLIASSFQKPVYFVLGNHDFYHGSLEWTERAVTLLAQQSDHLAYLPSAGVIELTPETALIGHGGWGDGRYGDYQNSWVMINDFVLIDELSHISKAERLRRIMRLGDQAAAYVKTALLRAFETHRRAIFLTHVPPFKEACWHQGRLSDDHFLPYFACKAVGDVLREIMQSRPEKDLLVLCGHTHGAGQAHILDNLRVLTGSADYGAPKIQDILEV